MERPVFSRKVWGIGGAAALALLVFSPGSWAAYEIWTRKDGKSAEMELLKVEQKDGEEMVSFRTRGGETVTMKLIDLQQADWKRARDAGAPPPALQLPTASFRKAAATPRKTRPDSKVGSTSLEFLFVITGETYAGIKEDSLVVEPFTIGGKILPAKGWTASGGAGPKSALYLRNRGDFEPGDVSGCKFTGSVIALSGTSRRTARVDAKVPSKTGKTDLNVGPLKVALTHGYETIDGKGTERHFLRVEKSHEDKSRILKCHFEVDGKEVTEIPYDKQTRTVPVVVEYWDKLVESTLKLEALAN